MIGHADPGSGPQSKGQTEQETDRQTQTDAQTSRAEPCCVVVLTTEGGSSPGLTADGERDVRRDAEKKTCKATDIFPASLPLQKYKTKGEEKALFDLRTVSAFFCLSWNAK